VSANAATAGDTTKIRLVAKEVVADQERVCAVQMGNISDKLDGVIEDVADVKEDVGVLKATFIKSIGEIKTEIAILKTRWTIGVALVASLPWIVDFVRGLFSK